MRKKHEQGLTSANCALNRGEVDGEILSSRKWTGHELAVVSVDPARQGKDAQMCLSREIIKRVTRRSRDAGDRNEVGNNVSDTRLVCGFTPASTANHPPTLYPLSTSSNLPLYACPPQIQTPN